MTKLSTAEARYQLAEIINRAAYGKERIVLTRRGREVVAVVSMEDLRLLEEIEEELDRQAIRKAWSAQGKKPPKDWNKVKRRFGIK